MRRPGRFVLQHEIKVLILMLYSFLFVSNLSGSLQLTSEGEKEVVRRKGPPLRTSEPHLPTSNKRRLLDT